MPCWQSERPGSRSVGGPQSATSVSHLLLLVTAELGWRGSPFACCAPHAGATTPTQAYSPSLYAMSGITALSLGAHSSAVALERTAWQQPVSAGAISDRGKQAVGAPALQLLCVRVGQLAMAHSCIVTTCSPLLRSP